MKRVLLILTVALSMAAMVPVAAWGGGYGHGYRHGGHFHGGGYRYGGGYRGGGGYRHGYGRYRYNDNAAQYFVGGVLLGALLTPPQRYAPAPVVVVPQPAPVVVATAPPVRTAPARRLFRDINGNCFERQVDGAGREVRLPLAATDCAW